ncbi:MAG: dihydropteroate synthase [Microthrixaceae bacterium]|nr:dihydropteroate synthase [Microthrixaceae bacterium]
MIPSIMGVLNVTPDSFSDGGRYVDLDAAVSHARRMVDEGADVIDVGGESTRPGAVAVSIDEELERVVPVIAAISGFGARISVDTRHEQVASAAIDAGASIINDVSASLWPVAARRGVGWLAMHMAGDPASMQQRVPTYRDVCREVGDELVAHANAAAHGGVAEIWIDPGIGFGKTAQHNLELVARIDELVATGIPVALGVSRKSTLGALCAQADRTPDRPPAPTDRLEAALTMAVWAMAAGVSLIRVHDVAAHVAALGMAFERLNAPNHLQNGLRAG